MKKVTFILLVCLLFTGCSNKKELDGENFKTYMEKKGYSIHDVYKQYSSDLVESALIALNEKGAYQIEFLEFKSEDYAKNSFQANRTLFKENKQEIKSGILLISIAICKLASTHQHKNFILILISTFVN